MGKKILLNIGLEILVNPDVVRLNELHLMSPHSGFVSSFIKTEPNLITVDQPYHIREGHIAVTRQECIHVLISLIKEAFQSDKLLVIVPNLIPQIIEISPNFGTQMIGIDAEFPSTIGRDSFLTHFS